jgi:hypothetical protein
MSYTLKNGLLYLYTSSGLKAKFSTFCLADDSLVITIDYEKLASYFEKPT